MLKLFLWLRYLRKKRILLLSIAAVTFSCALLIVVSSLFTSFINAFEQSAENTLGDIIITPPPGKNLDRYPELLARLNQLDQVSASAGIISAHGLLRLTTGDVRAVQVWGIDPADQQKVTDFKKSLIGNSNSDTPADFTTPQSSQRVAGYIGIAVASEPDELTDQYDLEKIKSDFLDKTLVLTTGMMLMDSDDPSQSTRPKRKVIPFTVTDIVFSGVYEIDSNFIYLPIEHLRKELYPDSKHPLATQLQIKLKPGYDPDYALADIASVFRNFTAEKLGWPDYYIHTAEIQTTKQMQQVYVQEYRKQMQILLLIFGVVSLSIILLIFCIFYMIVETKTKDIAIIRSCGATSGSLAAVFVGFGTFIALIGSALGIILGYIITVNVNTVENWIRIIFGLKLWKSSVYMFSTIPNQMDWSSVGPIVAFAVLAATVGALIPAFVAVKINPVKILRYE